MDKLVFAGEEAEKKKEMLIIAGVLLATIILFIIALLWRGGGGGTRPAPEVSSVKVENHSENGDTSTTFLVQPGPTELMAAMATTSEAELPLDLSQYQNTRVLWPLYFFRIREARGNTVQAMFDSNADGFGVSVQAEIDARRFPEIKEAPIGRRVWLAGELVAVDPSGTGSVRMKADFCEMNGELSAQEVAKKIALPPPAN
ncbi:MAG: hypothetical protein LBU39_01230 [Desulfobulbaceae bacterium]|jgi:hypothetical protein|nr:hypothetical protein [Desulfobulbaceae bacterium]